MKHARLSLLFLVLALASFTGLAQDGGRSYIREQIEKRDRCRNVAITKTNGDLMLYGRNGWAASDCPDGLTEALDELNEADVFIDEVVLTEDGRWLILYDDNGIRYYNIPQDLLEDLLDYQEKDEVINSITFNDEGEWLVITGNHVSASSRNITDYVLEGQDTYGPVWTACITDDAMVVVYRDGFKVVGDIPDTLEKALTDTDIDIYRLKIAGQSWFFSDGEDEYDYLM